MMHCGTGPAKSIGSAAPRKETPSLLTTKQVTQRFNCSCRTVLRMADDGLLTRRYLRPGNAKSLRFLEVEIAALCDLPRKGEG
jgi:hypothetical protein